MYCDGLEVYEGMEVYSISGENHGYQKYVSMRTVTRVDGELVYLDGSILPCTTGFYGTFEAAKAAIIASLQITKQVVEKEIEKEIDRWQNLK